MDRSENIHTCLWIVITMMFIVPQLIIFKISNTKLKFIVKVVTTYKFQTIQINFKLNIIENVQNRFLIFKTQTLTKKKLLLSKLVLKI